MANGVCDFCGIWHSGSCCHPRRLEFEFLGAEMAEARKDTARMNWLEKQSGIELYEEMDGNWTLKFWDLDCAKGNSLRSAIDSRLKLERGEAVSDYDAGVCAGLDRAARLCEKERDDMLTRGEQCTGPNAAHSCVVRITEALMELARITREPMPNNLRNPREGK